MRSGASAASTTEPAAPEASIVLFLANPKAFKELPGGARAEPGPVVDGTPSLRLIRAQPTTGQAREGRPASVDERLVEGYRLEAHGFHYYLLLISAQPHEPDLAALRAMVAGWRWLAPGPAHEALTPSGQLTRVAHDADLWFDIPQPFVNNPFRGEYYVAFSVVEKKSAAGAHFEVDELVGARDAAAARQAARDTPDYYETHGWDFAWRQTSSDPEVHVGGTTPTPPDHEGTIWHQAAVVARSREGRYFRILFTTHGRDPGVMKAYAAIVEDVARSVTTTPPPDEPPRRRGGSG
jgi:hypothetical protein